MQCARRTREEGGCGARQPGGLFLVQRVRPHASSWGVSCGFSSAQGVGDRLVSSRVVVPAGCESPPELLCFEVGRVERRRPLLSRKGEGNSLQEENQALCAVLRRTWRTPFLAEAFFFCRKCVHGESVESLLNGSFV